MALKQKKCCSAQFTEVMKSDTFWGPETPNQKLHVTHLHISDHHNIIGFLWDDSSTGHDPVPIESVTRFPLSIPFSGRMIKPIGFGIRHPGHNHKKSPGKPKPSFQGVVEEGCPGAAFYGGLGPACP